MFPGDVDTLIEPFAGSAAMTLFAAKRGLAKRFILNDVCSPLIDLWRMIVAEPENTASIYANIWRGQILGDDEYFYRVRAEFNEDQNPVKFLYLAARCVKNAVRFSPSGKFTQSLDRRRLGTRPETMKNKMIEASALLKGRVEFQSSDFRECLGRAKAADLVYMDPPYEGTTNGRDKRYYKGLCREVLTSALDELVDTDISFILSYDGVCGTRVYGAPLPERLRLSRHLLDAGRSSQATLNGHADRAYESVYVSKHLVSRGVKFETLPQSVEEVWKLQNIARKITLKAA